MRISRILNVEISALVSLPPIVRPSILATIENKIAEFQSCLSHISANTHPAVSAGIRSDLSRLQSIHGQLENAWSTSNTIEA
jgi:hypothetical protein